MTQEIKRRRGTTAQHASFTGAEAEVTVDTDKHTVVVHDGSTAGGFPLARESALDERLAKAENLADLPDASAARGNLGANNAANLTAGTLPDARVSATLTPDKAFRRGNILGTVSQSGGVPTGAIIQRGSNANGEFVRFADGTQICHNSVGSSGAGAVTWSYPATFSSAPSVFGTQAMGSDPSTGSAHFVLFGNVGSSTAQFSAVRSSTESRATVSCRLLAVGVWHS